MIGAFTIQVCPALAGQDRPILSDGVLIVSPAMWSLMAGADEKEIEHLLKNLFPIEIPGFVKA